MWELWESRGLREAPDMNSIPHPKPHLLQARRKPKIAKGARDFMPDQMAIREVGRRGGGRAEMQQREANSWAHLVPCSSPHAVDPPPFRLSRTLVSHLGRPTLRARSSPHAGGLCQDHGCV